MLIIGRDFHTGYPQIAMLDEATGEVVERRLDHLDGEAEAFYRSLPQPVRVGIEATGSIRWFQQLLTELGHELWVGHAAEIRARAVRQQKTDARDARHLLELLLSNRFPRIWVPSPEERDARQLLRHRFQLVGFRTSVKNQLHALAMGQGVCQRKKLWSAKGRVELERLTLDPWAHRRRQASFPSPPPNPPPNLSASLLLLLVSPASLRLFSYLLPLTPCVLPVASPPFAFLLFAFTFCFWLCLWPLASCLLPLASCLLHLASCISPRPLGACSIFARCLSAILPTAR